MNLKESFRYQNFLNGMISAAGASIVAPENGYIVKKVHFPSKVNGEAKDYEEVEQAEDAPKNDKVIQAMLRILDERRKLSEAIGKAKASIGFDLDAAIETNKSRQMIAKSIDRMLTRYKAKKSTERGVGYKFNVDGDQTEYYYDVEVSHEENFDRAAAKEIARKLITKADDQSSSIDAAMVNTMVDYQPPFNVNDSLEDIVATI